VTRATESVAAAASVTAAGIVAEMRANANPTDVEGMARFGIRPSTEVLGGTGLTGLRAFAKRVGHDQAVADALWSSGVHEARVLAAMVAEPDGFGRRRAESWVRDLDSWDVCDGFCFVLMRRTPFAWDVAVEWSARREEFVKRAGFALMAALAVHDKAARDERFLALLPVIEREVGDRRNYVRKGVNWALRQIGKRNLALNAAAVETARRIAAGPRGTTRIGTDALRELTSEEVRERLRKRATKSGAPPPPIGKDD